jgi:hypothetical protein
MKSVVLMGDSIRVIGYGKRVPELLGEEYSVWQSEDNGRFCYYTLRALFGQGPHIENADIVHWNNGLWDICELFDDGPFTPEDEYVRVMLRIARILKQRVRSVIFATTTPVWPDHPYNDNRVIRAYNERLVPELRKMGIRINDLYAVVADDIPGNIREDDKIHLSEKGIELCAEATAECIRRAAAELDAETENKK